MRPLDPHGPLRRLVLALERFCVPSFSQEGEDRILWRLTEAEPDGFYVDVGAHHPQRFSNSYLFYLQGWRGITVEPDPDAARAFRRRRPRDTHVTAGIAERPGELTYYRFHESALNTFDAALAAERRALAGCVERPPLVVPVTTLAALLDRLLPPGREITFLSVDAEGYDEHVLRSNDWQRFRPRYVLVESRGTSLASQAQDPSCALLGAVGYAPVARTMNTVFYARA